MDARRHLLRALRALAVDLRHPPFVPGGHYYSPVASRADVERAIARKRPPLGVDLREDEQLALVDDLGLEEPPAGRWQPNGMYGTLDAAVLRAMLRHVGPRRFVEVGAGYSTAAVLDWLEQTGQRTSVTCVEPDPARLLRQLRPGDHERMTLIRRPVQDLEPEEIASSLGPGDMLFADGTHVVKAGSDVAWLLLHTAPLLPVGTYLHLHDVHWPFEYPDDWLREGRNWTEAYLLHAFLMDNCAWSIVLFTSWLVETHPSALPPALRGHPAGSIWLRRDAGAGGGPAGPIPSGGSPG